jgi:hypothetical protein
VWKPYVFYSFFRVVDLIFLQSVISPRVALRTNVSATIAGSLVMNLLRAPLPVPCPRSSATLAVALGIFKVLPTRLFGNSQAHSQRSGMPKLEDSTAGGRWGSEVLREWCGSVCARRVVLRSGAELWPFRTHCAHLPGHSGRSRLCIPPSPSRPCSQHVHLASCQVLSLRWTKPYGQVGGFRPSCC